MYHSEYDNEYDEMSREEWLEYRQEIRREEREEEVDRQMKMIFQRLMGIRGDLDGTPLFITVPMGLYMLFSKECCIV